MGLLSQVKVAAASGSTYLPSLVFASTTVAFSTWSTPVAVSSETPSFAKAGAATPRERAPTRDAVTTAATLLVCLLTQAVIRRSPSVRNR